MHAVLVVHCNNKGVRGSSEYHHSGSQSHRINVVSKQMGREPRLHNFPNLVPKSGRQRKKGESRSYTHYSIVKNIKRESFSNDQSFHRVENHLQPTKRIGALCASMNEAAASTVTEIYQRKPTSWLVSLSMSKQTD